MLVRFGGKHRYVNWIGLSSRAIKTRLPKSFQEHQLREIIEKPQDICPGAFGSGRRIRTAQGLFQAVSANVIKYRQALQTLAFSKSIFHHVSKGNSQSYRDKGQDKGQKQGGIRENTALFPLLQSGFEGIPTHNKYAVKSSKAQIINCQEMYLKSRYIFR